MRYSHIAINSTEFGQMFDGHLTPEITHVDICTFRIGSNPALVDGLTSLAAKVSVRLLIGLGTSASEGDLETGRHSCDVDPCVAIAEECVSLCDKLDARYLNECHVKCWVFSAKKKNKIHTRSAIVGSRNLVLSKWRELMVSVDAGVAVEIKAYFDELWRGGTPIEEDPLFTSIREARKF